MLDTGSINTAGLMLYLVDLVGSATTKSGRRSRARLDRPDGIGAATFNGIRPRIPYTGPTIGQYGVAEPGQDQSGDGDRRSRSADYRRRAGRPGSAFVNIIYNNQFGKNRPGHGQFGRRAKLRHQYRHRGQLTLNGGNVVVNNVSGAIVLAGNIVVSANSSIGQVLNLGSTDHTVNVAAGVTLNLAGQILGSGGLTLNGPGTTMMTGNVENYYTGTTTVNSEDN